MHHHTTVSVGPEDTPHAFLGGGDHDIPVVTFTSSPGRSPVELHIYDLDNAVRFLDDLADECSSLATKIRLLQQRQAGDARLLAAVEASPGGEG
jgi:hypothetical protein